MDDGFQQSSTLTRRQALVIEAISRGGTITEAAEEAEVDRTTVYVWIRKYPDFAAEFNFARCESVEAVRRRIRENAEDAVRTVAELMKDQEVPPAVRLRAALAVIHSIVWRDEPNTIADTTRTWREERCPTSRLGEQS
jgi:transposase-like protein